MTTQAHLIASGSLVEEYEDGCWGTLPVDDWRDSIKHCLKKDPDTAFEIKIPLSSPSYFDHSTEEIEREAIIEAHDEVFGKVIYEEGWGEMVFKKGQPQSMNYFPDCPTRLMVGSSAFFRIKAWMHNFPQLWVEMRDAWGDQLPARLRMILIQSANVNHSYRSKKNKEQGEQEDWIQRRPKGPNHYVGDQGMYRWCQIDSHMPLSPSEFWNKIHIDRFLNLKGDDWRGPEEYVTSWFAQLKDHGDFDYYGRDSFLARPESRTDRKVDYDPSLRRNIFYNLLTRSPDFQGEMEGRLNDKAKEYLSMPIIDAEGDDRIRMYYDKRLASRGSCYVNLPKFIEDILVPMYKQEMKHD